jgi:hypothetical protein
MRTPLALALLGLLLVPSAAQAAPLCPSVNTVCVRETNVQGDCDTYEWGYNYFQASAGAVYLFGSRTCNPIQRAHSTSVLTPLAAVGWTSTEGPTSRSDFIGVGVGSALLPYPYQSLVGAGWYSGEYAGSSECNVSVRVQPAGVHNWVPCPAGLAPPTHPEIAYGYLLP